ncbi:MAG: DNA repair protein RecO [Acidimicrobiia bacterium]|nr:DNA repair protein RecO [Acidimicrobiia bacterium]
MSKISHQEGIVLRSYPFGEADRVVVLLSPERGKLRTVARGVRRVRSRLRGRLEPFCRVELVLHRGRELDLITSVTVVSAYPELRTDLDRLLAASTMVNAADGVSQAEQSSQALFGLLAESLEVLSQAEDIPGLTTAFLLRLAEVVGVAPALEWCASCGGTDRLARFSFAGGGVTCERCHIQGSVRLVGGVTQHLRDLARADLGDLPPTTVELSRQAMSVVCRFLEVHLDRNFRSLAAPS